MTLTGSILHVNMQAYLLAPDRSSHSKKFSPWFHTINEMKTRGIFCINKLHKLSFLRHGRSRTRNSYEFRVRINLEHLVFLTKEKKKKKGKKLTLIFHSPLPQTAHRYIAFRYIGISNEFLVDPPSMERRHCEERGRKGGGAERPVAVLEITRLPRHCSNYAVTEFRAREQSKRKSPLL